MIGLHGRGRAGNPEAARYLVEYHGFTKYRLSDPLRDLLLRINPVMPGGNERLKDMVSEHGWDRVRNHHAAGPAVRRMMNDAGAYTRDTFGRNVLLDLLDRWISEEFGQIGRSSARVVIADVNLDSEASWIRSRGGIIVALDKDIDTPGSDETDMGLSTYVINHTVHVTAQDDITTIGRKVSMVIGLEKETDAGTLRALPSHKESQ